MKTRTNISGFNRTKIISGSVSALALATALAATPAHALPVRDDVGPAGAVDVNNTYAGVGMMWNRIINPSGTISTFVCTGQLINPRTVSLAQHCTAGGLDAFYDPGAGFHMGFSFNPTDAFTGFDVWRRGGSQANPIINPFTGNWQSYEDQLFYNVLQVQTPFNDQEFFPGGDILIATLDTPAVGLPTYGMLLSPLSGPTHADLVGYGTTGTGSAGDVGGIDFQRRVGENMIDGLYSQNDFIAGVFNVPGATFGTPDAAQLLYHIDFDRPDRNLNDCTRGNFFATTPTANDIVCNTPPYGGNQPLTWDFTSAILTGDHIDWYPGDALPNEAGTAGGDSGSALFADEIFHRPLITGVLSGGWLTGFFSPRGGYSDTSYYNPLFVFRDWLVESNPYVYAQARHGSGNWSNPYHWVQAMDPNYFYIDRFGRVRNGLPRDPEPGYFADEPKWGTVFDLEIPTAVEGDTGPDVLLSELPATVEGVNNIGVYEEEEHGGGHGGPRVGSRRTGPTAGSGAPTGPGSRNFVPNNDVGTYGTWTGTADGTARFYDVTLDNFGKTRLDMNVEIDNLTISGRFSSLHVRSGFNLNSLVAVDQFRGAVDVDGTLSTREYMLLGGFLTGKGTINVSEALYNVNGVMSAGSLFGVGSMTINGNYVQTSAGDMVINIRRWGSLTNDFIQVNGEASLAGNAIVSGGFFTRPRWGDVYTVLNATNNVVGNFDNVDLAFASPVLFGESVVQMNGDVDIVVDAHSFSDIYDEDDSFYSLGEALDEIRWGGGYNAFSEVFEIVDNSTFDTLDTVMMSLTPHDAFMQSSLVYNFNNVLTGHLAGRGAELRAGVRGVSFAGLRSAFASAEGTDRSNHAALSPNGAGQAPNQDQRLGIFVSSRNFYNQSANVFHPGGDIDGYFANDFNPHANFDPFTNAGETYGDLAIGADYRLADDMAVGVAFSTSTLDLSSNTNGPVSNDNVGLAVYGTKYGRNWYIDAYYGYTRHDFEMNRATAGIFDRSGDSDWTSALSAPQATQSTLGMRAGWTFEPAKGLLVGPQMGATLSSTRFGEYSERAAGQLNLNVAERELTSVEITAGTSFRYNHVTDTGKVFSAFGDISVARELGDGKELVTAAFALAPENSFTVERLLDEQWYTTSLGLSYAVRSNLLTQVQVGADFDRGPLTQHYATFKFDWRF